MNRDDAETWDGQPVFSGRPEGQVLSGRYRILREVGSGGMGTVYQAEDMELDNMPVAVKVLPAILANNKRAVDNLRHEARMALKLTHPNIVRLHTFQSDEAIKYLIMEYVDGGSLEDRLADEGALSAEETLSIFTHVAIGLDYAHSQSVMHRDIKPANIMLTKDGVAKLGDFGIARQLKESMTHITGKQTSGTLLYMAPEQFCGGEPDPRTDIYSFAASIYECLCGHPPFWRGSIEYQILNEQPAPLDKLGQTQNDAILRALAKDPSRRQDNAKALLDELGTAFPSVDWKPAVRVSRDRALSDTWTRAKRAVLEPVHGPVAGQPWTVPEMDMTLAYVAPGSFMMGSNDEDAGNQEKPVHKIQITRGYWMGQHEVTNAQYQYFVRQSGYDGSREADADYLRHHKDCGKSAPAEGNYPAVCVSWSNASAFCRWLTERERQARRLSQEYVYRLPTEAEWEYAARGGAKSKGQKYCGSNSADEAGWHAANSGTKMHPVGQKAANELGLFDMSGNAWEWCSDWYAENYYARSPSTDPAGPSSGSGRVLRGGSRDNNPRSCRSSNRHKQAPRYTNSSIGFRVVVAKPLE